MGRRPRILVAGGIYHVYNRVSRGEHVFRDEDEADRFEALLAATKKLDDFQILAFCVMSNYYHLAVRMGEVSLSRSMGYIQHRFSQSYNGRHRVFGPFWQGRYRSKWIGDEEYLRQLIAYIQRIVYCISALNKSSRERMRFRPEGRCLPSGGKVEHLPGASDVAMTQPDSADLVFGSRCERTSSGAVGGVRG